MPELRVAEVREAVLLRRFHHLAAIAAVAVIAAAPAHAADFLAAVEDVPLMQGMVEQPDPVVFESDQGRVIRTSVECQIGAREISSFYIAALPALGWKRIDGGASLAFERENERLNINVGAPASSRPVVVSFELIVRLASTRLPE